MRVLRGLPLAVAIAAASCSRHDLPAPDLTVTATTPGDGDIEVDVAVQIQITFSADVDPRSVVGTNRILFVDSRNIAVAGSVTTSANIVTFAPGATLADNASYGVAVRKGVYTPEGVSLQDPVALVFSTGPTVSPIPDFPPFDDAAPPPPTPGTFHATGAMAGARRAPASASLADGRVLAHGGADSAGVPHASGEIYAPATGLWSRAGASSSTVGREGHTATRLADGRVLLAGGRSGAGVALASAETYDPALDLFVALAGGLLWARADHTATLLPNGNVLIAGGVGSAGRGLPWLEIYDPTTGAFAYVNSALLVPRARHTATLLPSGRVLLAGGVVGQGGPSAPGTTAAAELFDPGTGSGTLGVAVPTGAMTSSRAGHTATLLPGGQVLLAGGWQVPVTGGAATVLASIEVYDATAGAGLGAFAPTVTPLGTARHSHTATLLGTGRVLVAGGSSVAPPASCGSCGALRSAEILDPAGTTGIVSTGGAFGGIPTTLTATPTAGGGANPSLMGGVAAGRAEHLAALLPGGRVLLAGGSDCGPCSGGTAPFSLASAELYTP